MNLSEIKAKLGVETLPLTRAVNPETGEVQPFLIHWDNETRTRIIIHDDVMKEINTAGNLELNTKPMKSNTSGQAYTQKTIFLADKVEITL